MNLSEPWTFWQVSTSPTHPTYPFLYILLMSKAAKITTHIWSSGKASDWDNCRIQMWPVKSQALRSSARTWAPYLKICMLLLFECRIIYIYIYSVFQTSRMRVNILCLVFFVCVSSPPNHRGGRGQMWGKQQQAHCFFRKMAKRLFKIKDLLW